MSIVSMAVDFCRAAKRIDLNHVCDDISGLSPGRQKGLILNLVCDDILGLLRCRFGTNVKSNNHKP
jgi:hypothetical protein